MKNAFIKVSSVCLLLSAACQAEIEVGNGALQLDTSLTGVYDSNLRDSVNNISDYYLNFDPTLRYRRLGSRFNTEASVGLRVKRYLDNPIFDSNDANGSFDWAMQRVDGHTTAANLNLGYFENTDADINVNEIVRTKSFSANTSGEVLVADRNLFSAGISYHDNQRDIGSNQSTSTARAGYSYVGFSDGSALNFAYSHQQNKSTENIADVQTLDQKGDTVSVSFAHPLYDQLTGSLTYGYRWLDRGQQEALLGLPSQHGSFYGINFDGAFLPKKYFPKTTGTFRIAYEQADTPGLNDRSNERLVGQVNVSWAARETTTVGIFANRSQSLSITDNTVVYESTGVTLRQAVGSFVDVNFGLTYTDADFVNLLRTDHRYEANARANYKINRAWSSGVSYRYLKSDSNEIIANYTRHIVSGTVTYAF